MVRLGALLAFSNGVNASKHAYGHGVPFVNVLEVITASHLRALDIPGRVMLSQAQRDRFQVRRGDILFNRTSETQEEVGLSAVYQDDKRVVFGGFVIRGQPTSTELDSVYAGYAFRAAGVRAQITAKAQGAVRANIAQSSLKEVLVPLPPPPEQRAIAEALSDVDGLLRTLEALIAKKRAIKQAAMQQLLTGKTRLPGFSGEWKTSRLGEVAEIEMGQSPRSEFYNTNGAGLPLIQGNADISNRRTIERVFTTEITKQGKPGDIVLSVRAPVGEVARTAFDICLGRGVCAIRFPNDFLFHLLVYLEPSWGKHSKGSTFDSVNSADVRAVEIAFPNLEEQTAISAVLSDMDAEIGALERRRDKTCAIKRGMMQQLLTGRVRLVEPRGSVDA